MAFLSKFGNTLRQIASKQIRSELSPFKLLTHQATRCMSSMGSSKLFIGGISYQTDENSLREAFAKYGEVVDARIITDRDTGRSRGFGFITYNSSEEASSAIQALDGKDLHGRLVRVNYATDKPRNNFGYGGGDGGYGGGGGGGGYRGSGGYGNDSYSSGGTGDNYRGGNSFETGSGGGFGPPGGVGTSGANNFDFGTGGANNFGVGGESSFSTPGAHFGEDKGGFNLDDPVEGTNRDDDLGYQNRA